MLCSSQLVRFALRALLPFLRRKLCRDLCSFPRKYGALKLEFESDCLLIYARCPYCCCQEASRGTDLESHKSSSTPPSLVDISVLFECSPVVERLQMPHPQRLLPDNVRHGPRSSHASAPLARWIPIFTPFSLRSLIAPMMNPTSNPLQC